MVHAYIVLGQVLDVIPGNAYCTPFPLPLLRIDGLAEPANGAPVSHLVSLPHHGPSHMHMVTSYGDNGQPGLGGAVGNPGALGPVGAPDPMCVGGL